MIGMKENCKEIQQLLSGYFDNILSSENEYEVEVHLSHCNDCRVVLHDLMKISDTIADESHPSMPDEFLREVKPKPKPKSKLKLKNVFVLDKSKIKNILPWVITSVCIIGTLFVYLTTDKGNHEPVKSIKQVEPVAEIYDDEVEIKPFVPTYIEEFKYVPAKSLDVVKPLKKEIVNVVEPEKVITYEMPVIQIDKSHGLNYSSAPDELIIDNRIDEPIAAKQMLDQFAEEDLVLTPAEKAVIKEAESRARIEQQMEEQTDPFEVSDSNESSQDKVILSQVNNLIVLTVEYPQEVLGNVRDIINTSDFSVVLSR